MVLKIWPEKTDIKHQHFSLKNKLKKLSFKNKIYVYTMDATHDVF